MIWLQSIKYNSLVILFFTIGLSNSYCQKDKTLTEIKHFANNPGNLKMFVHSNLEKDSTEVPLVVVLHGCGQNANDVAELTGWNKLADLNNFVVLYPQQKMVNNPDLCFNWFNEHDIEKGKGESESIYQMISFVRKHYSIDSNRIYITGLSAGAAMSVVMTATHPDLFESQAIFAGGAYKIATNPIEGIKAMRGNIKSSKEKLIEDVRAQNPDYKGEYPTLIIYQGLNDPIVNSKSTDLLINQWTGINNSDTIPDKIEKAYSGVEDITRTEYLDSSGRLVITYYEVNNLGHKLMIKPGEEENEGGELGIFGIDKNFHSSYQTAKEFGILKE